MAICVLLHSALPPSSVFFFSSLPPARSLRPVWSAYCHLRWWPVMLTCNVAVPCRKSAVCLRPSAYKPWLVSAVPPHRPRGYWGYTRHTAGPFCRVLLLRCFSDRRVTRRQGAERRQTGWGRSKNNLERNNQGNHLWYIDLTRVPAPPLERCPLPSPGAVRHDSSFSRIWTFLGHEKCCGSSV